MARILSTIFAVSSNRRRTRTAAGVAGRPRRRRLLTSFHAKATLPGRQKKESARARFADAFVARGSPRLRVLLHPLYRVTRIPYRVTRIASYALVSAERARRQSRSCRCGILPTRYTDRLLLSPLFPTLHVCQQRSAAIPGHLLLACRDPL